MRFLAIALRILAWGAVGLYSPAAATSPTLGGAALALAALFGIASALVDYEREG